MGYIPPGGIGKSLHGPPGFRFPGSAATLRLQLSVGFECVICRLRMCAIHSCVNCDVWSSLPSLRNLQHTSWVLGLTTELAAACHGALAPPSCLRRHAPSPRPSRSRPGVASETSSTHLLSYVHGTGRCYVCFCLCCSSCGDGSYVAHWQLKGSLWRRVHLAYAYSGSTQSVRLYVNGVPTQSCSGMTLSPR
jgi:hypothetical protein